MMTTINDLYTLIINNNTNHFQTVLRQSSLSQEHLGHLLVYVLPRQPTTTSKLIFETVLHNYDANLLLFPKSCSCNSCINYK